MNLTVGVYDLFAYASPGSLYLALIFYIADRLSWIDPLRVLQFNTTLVIVFGVLLSYLIGHITYDLGYLLSRAYGHDKNIGDAGIEFVERIPDAKGRPFLEADRFLLLAAIEMHGIEAAGEIGRLRAIGLMLRNSAPVFLLGAITELADMLTGAHPAVAGCCIVLFLLAALGCLRQSAIIRHWANIKTLQLAYLVPDIDRGLGHDGFSLKRSQGDSDDLATHAGRRIIRRFLRRLRSVRFPHSSTMAARSSSAARRQLRAALQDNSEHATRREPRLR